MQKYAYISPYDQKNKNEQKRVYAKFDKLFGGVKEPIASNHSSLPGAKNVDPRNMSQYNQQQNQSGRNLNSSSASTSNYFYKPSGVTKTKIVKQNMQGNNSYVAAHQALILVENDMNQVSKNSSIAQNNSLSSDEEASDFQKHMEQVVSNQQIRNNSQNRSVNKRGGVLNGPMSKTLYNDPNSMMFANGHLMQTGSNKQLQYPNPNSGKQLKVGGQRIMTSKQKQYYAIGSGQDPMNYGRVQKSGNQNFRPPVAKKRSSKVDVYPGNVVKRGSSLAAYVTSNQPQTMSPKGQNKNPVLSQSQLFSDRSQPQRPKPNILLSDDEKAKFGNRCPAGYKKIQILGKGGIAIVWLAIDQQNGQQVAMKQFPKAGKKFDSSASVEIQIQTILQEKAKSDNIKGIEHICRLITYCEDKKDLWLIYEVVDGKTMNEEMFNVKGEFYHGERIYKVHHSILYHTIRNNHRLMIDFLRRMSEFLNLLTQAGVVHADLKPDNIIIDFDEEKQAIKTLKVIDFGSAFLLNDDDIKLQSQIEFGQSTPEYLPPEIQTYLTRKYTSKENYQIQQFSEIGFVFDVWSLGSIMIEILSGFPLWLSLKSRVVSMDGRSMINYGIFGVSGRDNAKILQKQSALFGDKGGIESIKKLKAALKKNYDYTGNKLYDDQLFISLLSGILEIDPEKRMSPEEILESDYITQQIPDQ